MFNGTATNLHSIPHRPGLFMLNAQIKVQIQKDHIIDNISLQDNIRFGFTILFPYPERFDDECTGRTLTEAPFPNRFRRPLDSRRSEEAIDTAFGRADLRAPLLGEHGAQVLKEMLEYSEARIAKLKEGGILFR